MINEINTNTIKAIEKGVRVDGRKPKDYRELNIETGVVETAEGSARVSIGDTQVIAGVKFSIEKPYADTPDQGNFMVNVELLPLSNPAFETGAPSIQAIEIARVTDRCIRESKAIDVKKLCIEPGSAVWGVIVDICTINDAGSLLDACAIAALAALKSAKFPEIVEENGERKIDYKHLTEEQLKLEKVPLGITVYRMGAEYIVDPVPTEEQAADARLTVGSLDDGTLCSLQKGGNGGLSIEDVDAMVSLSIATADMIRKKL